MITKRIIFNILTIICFYPLIFNFNGFNFRIPYVHELLIGDVGIINTVNEIRGEASNSLLSKILFNKSFYGLVFLNNASRLFDFKYLSSVLLLGSLLPLFYGVYVEFVKNRRRAFVSSLLLICTFLLFGLLRNIDGYLYVVVPVFYFFIYSGISNLNLKFVSIVLLINFVIVSTLKISL